MKTRRTRLFALLACLSMLFANQMQAQDTDDLQRLIDQVASSPQHRASGTVTDIDLSAYSEPRTTTLYVRNGVNVRFVNGTLKRASSLTDAPLVQIKDGASLHLAESATISGNDIYTSNVPIVELLLGILEVEGGTISGNQSPKKSVGPSVQIDNNGDNYFDMYKGYIQRLFNVGGGNVTLYGGHIFQLNSYGVITCVSAPQIDSCVLQNEDAYVFISDPGENMDITFYGYSLGQTLAKLEDSYWESVAKKCLKLGGNEGYTLSYENQSFIVRQGVDPNYITSEDDLQKRLDEIAAENPAEPVTLTIQDKGITITKTIEAKSGCNAIITGGKITVSKQFKFSYWNSIFVNEGLLGFIDIIINGNFISNDTFFVNNGKLTIGNNVRYENIYDGEVLSFYLTLGKLIVRSGDLTINGPVFYPTHGGELEIYGGNFHSLNDKNIITGDYSAIIKGGILSGGPISIGDLILADMEMGAIPELNVSSINSWNIHIYRVMKLPQINLSLGGLITLDWHYREWYAQMNYQGKWRISSDWANMELDKPFVVSGYEKYPMTLNDFNNMEFIDMPDDREAYFDATNKCVRLRIKRDPNYITSEDDLQKRLDEIAAEKPSIPVTLTIQEKGITLSTVITARSGCKAILTGGNISLTGEDFGPDLIFRIEYQADLRFENIYLDFSPVEKIYFWHFLNNGNLTLDQGVNINAKNLYFNGNCVLHGSARLPLLYLNGETPRHTRIYLSAKMTDTWIFDSEWKFLVEDEPYTLISGYLKYEVTADDYSRMQFVNLPDDVEIVYNDELKVVQVQKKTKECDLQSLLDGLCDVDPDCDDPSCRDIPVYDDVVVGCKEDPLQCAVDKVIDGDEDNPTPALIPIPDLLPNICMCCVCPSPRPSLQVIHIYPYSSLTIRNYNIKGGKYANQYIQVYGTLIIDVNVYIYRFIRFIHIMPGGRVIWRGGHVEDVDEIVYNEGGTLEIEGDFDNGGKRFVNPEGCTLIIRDGTFTGDIENHGTLIIEGGEVKGKVENYKDFRMEGGTVDYEIWSETDIWIKGGVRVTNIHIKRGCRVHVIGRLKAVWRIHFFNIDDFDVYVPVVFGDDSYQLTAEDCEYVQIELPAGYRWEYYKGVIVIVRIPYDVATIVEYLDYFGPQGTWEKPWSFVYDKTNIDINIDWHIVRDYHLIFDGGTFTMNGGDIYIDQGASLWLKNIRFRGIDRHVYVYGTLYIDENVDFADIVRFIHVCRGGEIRFVTKPDYTVNIIVGEEDIVIDKAVIYGIIKAWLQYLNITLPDGYKWEYDDATHTIAITFSSGINDIQADRNAEEPVYDLSGKKLSKPRKGLNIVGGKKAVIK